MKAKSSIGEARQTKYEGCSRAQRACNATSIGAATADMIIPSFVAMAILAATMPCAISVVATLAGVDCGDEVPVEPCLDNCLGSGRRNADDHLDPNGVHALLRAAAHAPGQDDADLLGGKPVGPAAGFRHWREDRHGSEDRAAGGIDLEEAGLGGGAEMKGEAVRFSQWHCDDHGNNRIGGTLGRGVDVADNWIVR